MKNRGTAGRFTTLIGSGAVGARVARTATIAITFISRDRPGYCRIRSSSSTSSTAIAGTIASVIRVAITESTIGTCRTGISGPQWHT